MKIVLITSGQPSLNPRLVKEVNTLIEVGFDVTVIYQYWNAWGTIMDESIITDWKTHRVGGDPISQRFVYFKTRFTFKIIKFLTRKLRLINFLAELSLGRCTQQLINKAKSIKADLYIAHNLAALPAVVLAAKKNKAKCGFDAEDFHRNEISDDSKNFDAQLSIFIENKYIPQLDYLTTASPLISLAYSEIYPKIQPLTILNVFPKQLVNKKDYNYSRKLKLFWFSQTIGINRGLESIIKALGLIKETIIELHLLGNHNEYIKEHFLKIANESDFNSDLLFYYFPIPAHKIYEFASQFDVGLATEMSTPKNRDICLTNKIFTYLQSGLAILASNTTAQRKMTEEYPNIGIIYDQCNIGELAGQIRYLGENNDVLKIYQSNSKKYGNEILNWETEKVKYLAIIAEQLI